MRYEDPYAGEMKEAMDLLLAIANDTKNKLDDRLKAINGMSHIATHALQADVIRDISESHGDKADKLTEQVKRLNARNKKPWEDDEDEPEK